MTQDSQSVHALSGAYALDALPDLERRRFEDHLAACETCAEEVRGIREAAGRLGAAAAVPTPAGLRDRVLAEVSRTRQAGPLPDAPPRSRTARSRTSRPRGGRVVPRLLAGAAAACVAVAAASGVVAYRADQRADRLEAAQGRVAAVLSAPDARAVTAPVRTGGRGTVIVSRQRDRAVVLLTGVPAAPPAKTYELWLMGDGAPRPAGTTGRPAGPIPVADVGAATQVGLTIEPAAGSLAPTTEPIFVVPLPT